MNDAAPKPDDSQLRRLLTGELPADEEATVLALVEHEPAWQVALDAQAASVASAREAPSGAVSQARGAPLAGPASAPPRRNTGTLSAAVLGARVSGGAVDP